MNRRLTSRAAAAAALLSVSMFSFPTANAMTASWPSTARIAADDLSATETVQWCRCPPRRASVYTPSRSRVVVREGRRDRVGVTVREGSRTSIRTGGSVRTQGGTTVRTKATVKTQGQGTVGTGTRSAPSKGAPKAAPAAPAESPAR